MENAKKEMMKLQNKMVLESLATIEDMIEGNKHFVIENRSMVGGRDANRWLWDDYDYAFVALGRALSDIRYAKEQLKYAEGRLERGE